MKNDKNSNNDSKIIFKVLFYLLIALIPIILFVVGLNFFFDPLFQDSQYFYQPESINFKNTIFSPTLWLVIVGSILFVYFLLKSEGNINTKIENIKRTTPEVKGMIVDILIYRRASKSKKYRFYPIIESFDDSKWYVFFDYYGIQNYGHIFYDSIFKKFKYSLYSAKNKTIKVGDTVKFYIVKKISNCRNINNSIKINGKSYKYLGKYSELEAHPLVLLPGIINESQDDFLEKVDNIVLFDGFIDFDYEN